MKPNSLAKLDWLDRAVAVYNYHVNLVKTEKRWTIKDTAESLNRSTGSVSQDITVASWTRTHEKQLRRFHTMRDAIDYIREKKAEMRTLEVEVDE